MKWRLLTALLCGGGALVAAPAQAGKVNIVTSTPELAAIASQIGGPHVTVESIAAPGQDPHFIAAKPSYMVKLRRADLFIRIGMELEIGWEDLLLRGSRNAKIQTGQPGHLDTSEQIDPLDLPAAGTDRSAGDVHALGNPHYWLDPLNGIKIAQSIGARLSQLDPKRQAFYAGRVSEIEHLLLERLHGPGGWAQRLAPFAGTAVLTFHRSWSYLLARFGLVSVGELEPKPGLRPGPRHLAEIVKTARQQAVQLILMEPFYDRSSADLVASKSGARIVQVANTVAQAEAIDSYIQMFDTIVDKLVSALNAGQADD